jgi:hypothetical protein
MTRHQIIGMRPAGQRFHAAEPRRDILVLCGDVEAEFLGRIVKVADKRNVGDGRL